MTTHRLLKYASWAMIFTAIAHFIGHFLPPELNTEEKQEMMRLMTTVQFELDTWFSRSVKDLFDAFSLFLTVMLLICGGICWLISSSSIVPINLIKKIALVGFIGMMTMTVLSIIYAFSIPIFLFFVITILLLLTYVQANKEFTAHNV